MLAEGAGGRPWLVVVGIGADGMAGLGEAARRAVAAGEVLVGGARHLAMVPDDGRPRVPWRSPLAATLGEIGAHRGRPVVVLATGDPLWYGVGRLLVRHFGAAEVRVLPHVSAFQLAAARLGWALEEVVKLERARAAAGGAGAVFGARATPFGACGGRENAGCRGGATAEHGYGRSRAWVLEELGGPGERIVEAGVGGLQARPVRGPVHAGAGARGGRAGGGVAGRGGAAGRGVRARRAADQAGGAGGDARRRRRRCRGSCCGTWAPGPAG